MLIDTRRYARCWSVAAALRTTVVQRRTTDRSSPTVGTAGLWDAITQPPRARGLAAELSVVRRERTRVAEGQALDDVRTLVAVVTSDGASKHWQGRRRPESAFYDSRQRPAGRDGDRVSGRSRVLFVGDWIWCMVSYTPRRGRVIQTASPGAGALRQFGAAPRRCQLRKAARSARARQEIIFS